MRKNSGPRICKPAQAVDARVTSPDNSRIYEARHKERHDNKKGVIQNHPSADFAPLHRVYDNTANTATLENQKIALLTAPLASLQPLITAKLSRIKTGAKEPMLT